MSYLKITLRIVLGLVFIFASLDKIANPQAFADIVMNYQLLPGTLITPVAIFLPWLELVCGLAIVLDILSRGAVLMVSGLLTLFMAALLYNLIMGLDVACGCFSTSSAPSNTLVYLIRDSGIFVLGLAVLRQTFSDNGKGKTGDKKSQS